MSETKVEVVDPAADADQQRTKMSRIMVGAAAAILIGSFLPWAHAAGDEGLGGFSWGPGKFTAVAAILLGLYGLQGLRKDDPRVRHHGWAIAAVTVGLICAAGATQLLDTIDSLSFGAADVGMGNGLLLTFVALCFAIWPLVVLRRDDRERFPPTVAVHAPATGAPAAGSGAPDSTVAAPAGWHADPTGRFEQRYYDGAAWTEHVARGSERATDPIA